MEDSDRNKKAALQRLADDSRHYFRAMSDRHSAMRRAREYGATWAEIAKGAGCSESTARRMVG